MELNGDGVKPSKVRVPLFWRMKLYFFSRYPDGHVPGTTVLIHCHSHSRYGIDQDHQS